MIRKIYFLIIMLFISLFSGYETNAQDIKKWTLEECIDYALRNNLLVKQSQLSVRDNELLLKQSKAELLPSLNVGGSYSNRWGRSIDPTTNQFDTEQIRSLNSYGQSQLLVYGGSRLRNTIKQNKTLLEGSQYDLQKVENDIMLSVATDFLNVILNKELLENAQLQLQTTQAQLETTSKQVKAGALPISSELDLIAQVESNKVRVINSENDVRLANLRLKQLLMIPSEEPFDIVIPEFDEDLTRTVLTSEDLYTQSKNIMPEVQAAEKTVLSADLGVKIARGWFDPRLSVSADVYSNYSSVADRERYILDPDGTPTTVEVPIGYFYNPIGPTPETIPVFKQEEIPAGNIVDGYPVRDQFSDNISNSIGISLMIPIFNGLQTRTGYQRAKIQSEKARLYAEETRQVLRQNIELAYNNALAASETYNASTKQVASLEESFRAAEKSYNLGAMNIYDYQVASNNLFRARSDLLRAKYNYIFTVKVLDFYLGKPLSLD